MYFIHVQIIEGFYFLFYLELVLFELNVVIY
jgi:hypothetical protein